MKRLTLLFAFSAIILSNASAQLDIKVGPVGLLFSNLNVGIEYGVSENWGIELTPGLDWKALNLLDNDEIDFKGNIFKVGLNGRYYFNPNEKGLNGFYAGVYTRYGGGKYSGTDTSTDEKYEFTSTRLAGGFLLGGKIVARNERLIFDLGLGFGRAFIHKYEDPNGTDEADLSNVPFFNFDLPINLKIGYRISK